MRTALKSSTEETIIQPQAFGAMVFALGLTGESGEVADLIKKWIGHDHPLDLEKLRKELGDVLWYIAAIADNFHIDLSDIAVTNILKLRSRYPDGFSSKMSQNRDGEPQ